MLIFDAHESNVRSYCRSFQDVFVSAKNDIMYAESGKAYIDFFAGAGALNYGHNDEYIKQCLIRYLESDGVTHGLDMYTDTKRLFIDKFVRGILNPRGLEYKLQFCGTTGTNAVEAALKLARKVKQRSSVFSFMGGFHGMSLGSLAATSNRSSREGAGLPLEHVTFMPYPFGYMDTFDTLQYMENVLNDDHSGIDKPAAVIFETVQAEGGIVPVTPEWMRGLADLCARHDILLICDDIQVGCGRTGTFFSFERAGIAPDMVTLSKSISGYGLPMSLLLMKPEHDIWSPGEHNGTFRGNQTAFIAATAALELRERIDMDRVVLEKEAIIREALGRFEAEFGSRIAVRGIGMIWGVDLAGLGDPDLSLKIVGECFERGLILERVGRNDSVIKIMPPLTVDPDNLRRGLDILYGAMLEHIAEHSKAGA